MNLKELIGILEEISFVTQDERTEEDLDELIDKLDKEGIEWINLDRISLD